MTEHNLLDRVVRPGSPVRAALLLLLFSSAALLAGCAEESSEDRRFANEPAPTEDRPTATTAAAESTEAVAPTSVQASPASLLQARGAPDRVFTGVGQQLWVIEGDLPRRLPLPSGLTILAFDGSPSGDRVAVVAMDADTGVSLLILDAAGTQLRRIDNVVAVPPSAGATPAPSTTAGPEVVVDWGLQGDTILVAAASGGASAVPVEGEPQAVSINLQDGRLLAALLSPRGDQIAVLRRDRDGLARLAVTPLDAGPGAESRVIAPREGQVGRTVRSMAWLPDGGSLLYVEGAAGEDGMDSARDLFSIRLAGLERKLVATGGAAGPAGTILDFQASPDGRAVAYVVGIPEGDGVSVHSAWIVSLRDPIEYRIPTDSSATITRLWWTSDGLMWGVDTESSEGNDSLTLYQVGPDGTAEARFTIDGGPGSATPMARTPGASPIASPGAEATPTT